MKKPKEASMSRATEVTTKTPNRVCSGFTFMGWYIFGKGIDFFPAHQQVFHFHIYLFYF